MWPAMRDEVNGLVTYLNKKSDGRTVFSVYKDPDNDEFLRIVLTTSEGFVVRDIPVSCCGPSPADLRKYIALILTEFRGGHGYEFPGAFDGLKEEE